MKAVVPKPLQSLVRVSEVKNDFIQKLKEDEFTIVLRNSWEDGLRHRLEGNNRMAYVCWMNYFLTLFKAHAFRKDIHHLIEMNYATMEMLKWKLNAILVLSNEIVAQERYRFKNEPKTHTNAYLYEMYPQ